MSIVTDTVPLSSDRTAVVRRLGWKALKAAKDAKQLDAQSTAIELQRRHGADYQEQIRRSIEAAGGIEKIKEIAATNPLLGYDQATLLYRGVVSISGAEGVPTPEQIDDLDEADAAALASRIAELSGLKSEAERKNV